MQITAVLLLLYILYVHKTHCVRLSAIITNLRIFDISGRCVNMLELILYKTSSTVVYLISIISVVDISCFFFLLSASFVRLFSSSHQHILLEIIGSPTQFHSFDNVEQKSQMLHQTFFSRLMYR